MKPTLLLADGDAEIRELYCNLLARHGYDVVPAADGLDCLQKLNASEPDVLVLDLEMIWGGGDGVLGWLREQTCRPPIPVVLTGTAGCSPDTAADAAAPVVEFLTKPFALTDLLKSLQDAMARKPSAPNRNYGSRSEMYIG
jgi:CheY-like chemotaxis protein